MFFQVVKVNEEPAKLLFGNAAAEVLDAEFEFDVASVSLESAILHRHLRIVLVDQTLLVRTVNGLHQQLV